MNILMKPLLRRVTVPSATFDREFWRGSREPEQKIWSLEIIFGTPTWALLEQQAPATHLASLSMLASYRRIATHA